MFSKFLLLTCMVGVLSAPQYYNYVYIPTPSNYAFAQQSYGVPAVPSSRPRVQVIDPHNRGLTNIEKIAEGSLVKSLSEESNVDVDIGAIDSAAHSYPLPQYSYEIPVIPSSRSGVQVLDIRNRGLATIGRIAEGSLAKSLKGVPQDVQPGPVESSTESSVVNIPTIPSTSSSVNNINYPAFSQYNSGGEQMIVGQPIMLPQRSLTRSQGPSYTFNSDFIENMKNLQGKVSAFNQQAEQFMKFLPLYEAKTPPHQPKISSRFSFNAHFGIGNPFTPITTKEPNLADDIAVNNAVNGLHNQNKNQSVNDNMIDHIINAIKNYCKNRLIDGNVANQAINDINALRNNNQDDSNKSGFWKLENLVSLFQKYQKKIGPNVMEDLISMALGRVGIASTSKVPGFDRLLSDSIADKELSSTKSSVESTTESNITSQSSSLRAAEVDLETTTTESHKEEEEEEEKQPASNKELLNDTEINKAIGAVANGIPITAVPSTDTIQGSNSNLHNAEYILLNGGDSNIPNNLQTGASNTNNGNRYIDSTTQAHPTDSFYELEEAVAAGPQKTTKPSPFGITNEYSGIPNDALYNYLVGGVIRTMNDKKLTQSTAGRSDYQKQSYRTPNGDVY